MSINPGAIERSSESTIIVETGDTPQLFCSLTVWGSSDMKVAWQVKTNQTGSETLISESEMVEGKLNSTIDIKTLAIQKKGLRGDATTYLD